MFVCGERERPAQLKEELRSEINKADDEIYSIDVYMSALIRSRYPIDLREGGISTRDEKPLYGH